MKHMKITKAVRIGSTYYHTASAAALAYSRWIADRTFHMERYTTPGHFYYKSDAARIRAIKNITDLRNRGYRRVFPIFKKLFAK